MLGGVGLDDANDARGEPGACPGHDFVLQSMKATAAGTEMVHECTLCGAVTFRAPGWSTRGETSPGLSF